MNMCDRPGCVAEAGAERQCAVHRHADGAAKCEACFGSGYRFRGVPCDRCGGCGLKDKKTSQPRAQRGSDPVDERGLIAGTD